MRVGHQHAGAKSSHDGADSSLPSVVCRRCDPSRMAGTVVRSAVLRPERATTGGKRRRHKGLQRCRPDRPRKRSSRPAFLLGLLLLALAAAPPAPAGSRSGERAQGPAALWKAFPLDPGPPAVAEGALRSPAPGRLSLALPARAHDAAGSQPDALPYALLVVFGLLAATAALLAWRPSLLVRFPSSPARPSGLRRAEGSAGGYVLVVPTRSGRRLVERSGTLPQVGELIYDSQLGRRSRFVVDVVGPSPLPGDRRFCAFLTRV